MSSWEAEEDLDIASWARSWQKRGGWESYVEAVASDPLHANAVREGCTYVQVASYYKTKMAKRYGMGYKYKKRN